VDTGVTVVKGLNIVNNTENSAAGARDVHFNVHGGKQVSAGGIKTHPHLQSSQSAANVSSLTRPSTVSDENSHEINNENILDTGARLNNSFSLQFQDLAQSGQFMLSSHLKQDLKSIVENTVYVSYIDRLIIHSFIHPYIYSSIHPSIHSFIHVLIDQLNYLSLL
jgi:hypothetical protein